MFLMAKSGVNWWLILRNENFASAGGLNGLLHAAEALVCERKQRTCLSATILVEAMSMEIRVIRSRQPSTCSDDELLQAGMECSAERQLNFGSLPFWEPRKDRMPEKK
jgi:hypothetical protein